MNAQNLYDLGVKLENDSSAMPSVKIKFVNEEYRQDGVHFQMIYFQNYLLNCPLI